MTRIRSALLAALLPALLATGFAIPAAAAPVTPEVTATGCAASLACTADELNQLSIADRLTFVRALSAGPAAAIAPGYTPRWRNIEGILEFFRERSLGAPGSWVSYVDAGILEGIERGIAIASGRGTDTFGNPGSTLWASYLTRLGAGLLQARSAHDLAWSRAEQASTDHGVALAEQVHGLRATPVEQRFFDFSQFYREVLRTEPPLLDPVRPGPGPGPQRQPTFLDWFTDVGNDVPARRGAELAYSLAEYDLPGGAAKTAALLAAYGRALAADFLAYLDQTGQAG